MYKLFLHPNVEKQLSNIPTPYAKRIADAIRALRSEPRPPGFKHLSQELYRVRVGEYRIIFAVFDQEQVIFVGKVARRSAKVYRDVAAILSTARKSVRKD